MSVGFFKMETPIEKLNLKGLITKLLIRPKRYVINSAMVKLEYNI